MTDQRRWTHEELKTILERGPIADLEKLLADPGRKYRQEFAHDYAIRPVSAKLTKRYAVPYNYS